MGELEPADRPAILSRDTTADAERRQIQLWRRMSSLEKIALVSRSTTAVLDLAQAGIRERHPGASERECFIRLATLKLGSRLVRIVYPDALEILGPAE